MPSSLAVIHSYTSGYSPRPPVSVYGTGRASLHGAAIFSLVCLPALSGCPRTPGTVGFQPKPTAFNPLFRQEAAVSLPGLASPRCTGTGILTGCTSRSAWRCSGNLGLAVCAVLSRIIVTHAYIFFSGRSRPAPADPSQPSGMLPYRWLSASPGLRRRA